MRAYSWRDTRLVQENFGDEITGLLLRKLGQDHVWSPPERAELVVTGSVLEHLPTHWTGSICGAGKLHENSKVYLPDARVFALRGKLTAASVRGLKGNVVLGDPGLLLPKFIRQPQAKYDLGVIPHWSDTELRHRFSYGRFIDPCQPPEKVIAEIISCKRIISSSLHGIIVADAYGIPRQAELFSNAGSEGGDFKYRDYASALGDHPHFGHMHRAPRQKIEALQDALLPALQQAVGIDLPLDGNRHPQLSILVPFRDDGEHRSRVWRWLRRYWRAQGLDAEIIQGFDDGGNPFSKAVAVNQAATLARGHIFLVLDADAYMSAATLQRCADHIETRSRSGTDTWLMPYNYLYRLAQDPTLRVLSSSPEDPAMPSTAVPHPRLLEIDYGGYDPSPNAGHQYGAMAMMMPRDGFYAVGGMDPRFRGWGSEDVSMLRSLDTLWGQHEVAVGPILHMWHERVGNNHLNRRWVGQPWEVANSRLAQRYATAYAEPEYMQGLADEHPMVPPLYY